MRGKKISSLFFVNQYRNRYQVRLRLSLYKKPRRKYEKNKTLSRAPSCQEGTENNAAYEV